MNRNEINLHLWANDNIGLIEKLHSGGTAVPVQCFMCHYYQDNRFHCGNKTWATHRNPYPLWWRACFSFAALCGWTHIDFQALPCFGDGLWACFLSLCLSTPTPHLHSVMGDGFAILNPELHFGYTETLQRKKKKSRPSEGKCGLKICDVLLCKSPCFCRAASLP